MSATELLAVDRLRGESGTAAALLELLSLFGPAPVPLELFQPGTEIADDALRSAVTSPLTFAELIGPISRYSLAARVGDALQVHRLVARTRLARSHADLTNLVNARALGAPRACRDLVTGEPFCVGSRQSQGAGGQRTGARSPGQ